MEENKQFDDQFKEALENFEMDIEPQIWDNIEEELHPKKKRLGIIWWGSGIAASLLVGMIMFFNSNSTDSANIMVEANDNLQSKDKNNIVISLDSVHKEIIEEMIVASIEEDPITIVASNNEIVESYNSKETYLELVPDTNRAKEEKDVLEYLLEDEEELDSIINEIKKDSIKAPIPVLEFDIIKPTRNTMIAANFNSSSSGVSLAKTDLDASADQYDNGFGYSESANSVDRSNTITDKSIKAVTGISIDKPIGNMSFVGLGLAYTSQSFTFYDGSKERISGIGIPLTFRRTLKESESMVLYSLGGVMIEKTISSNRFVPSTISTFNLAIGGDYTLFKQWKLYGQIGISKEYMRYLKEKIKPNVQVGIRYLLEKKSSKATN